MRKRKKRKNLVRGPEHRRLNSPVALKDTHARDLKRFGLDALWDHLRAQPGCLVLRKPDLGNLARHLEDGHPE